MTALVPELARPLAPRDAAIAIERKPYAAHLFRFTEIMFFEQPGEIRRCGVIFAVLRIFRTGIRFRAEPLPQMFPPCGKIHGAPLHPGITTPDDGPGFPHRSKIYDSPLGRTARTISLLPWNLFGFRGDGVIWVPPHVSNSGADPMTAVQSAIQTELQRQANDVRNEASSLPACKKRNTLLEKARELDTSANIEGWLNSPELQPPTGK